MGELSKVSCASFTRIRQDVAFAKYFLKLTFEGKKSRSKRQGLTQANGNHQHKAEYISYILSSW